MERLPAHRRRVSLWLLAGLLLFVTCTETGQGPGRGTRPARVEVTLLKTSFSATIAQVTLRALVNDVIAHQDTTAVVGNSFQFDDFSLPVGEATIIVDAIDENGVVVYSAQTTIIITTGQVNTVQLQLVPVAALMRLAPFHRVQNTQDKFVSTLEMYNVARLASTEFVITYNPSLVAFDYHTELADNAWGSTTIDADETLPGQLHGTFTRDRISDDAVPSGATELVDFRFHAIAPGTADIALAVTALNTLTGAAPEFSDLTEDGQTVDLIGPPDDVAEIGDSTLLNLLRVVLGKTGGDVFVSELEGIVEIVASHRGITSIEGLELLTGIHRLDLTGNQISDLTPLIDNPGLDDGDTVILRDNPLGDQAMQQVTELRNRGVIVIISVSFTGTVTDAATSDSLSGVSVNLTGAAVLSTTTDATGGFEFPDLNDGIYQVALGLSGYDPDTDTVTIAGVPVVRDYTLTETDVSTTVSGIVTESAGGSTPIVGATVTLSGPSFGQTTTDNQGMYEFTGVEPGQYTLTVAASGYEPALRQFTVDPSTPEVQNFSLALVTYTLSGTVTDVSTKRPIGGARVKFTGPVTDSGFTNSSGAYAFVGLLPGQYNLEFSAALYDPDSRTFTILDADVVQDAALTPIPQITSISGTVTNDSQSPISGATVTLSGPGNAQTTTDAQGAYDFAGVAPGTYTLGASASGYAPDSRQITAVAGVPLENEDFVLSAQLFGVSGIVTDSVTGNPIPQATLILSGPVSDTTTTSQLGFYDFSNLPAGQYTLEVSASGYVGKARGVTVTSGSPTEDFELSPVILTTTLSGTVTVGPVGAAPIPISGATVVLSGTSNAQTTTNGNGFYQFVGVPLGSYTISVSAMGFQSGQKDTTISSSAPVIVDFLLLPNVYSLSGTISEGPGATIPIAGATVELAGPVGGQTTTGATGFYEFTDLPDGDYDIVVSATGYIAQSRSVTVSGSDLTSEDFALLPLTGTVSGSVTESGASTPIAGAVILLDGKVQRGDTTDFQGFYQLSNVQYSSGYTLHVSANRYARSDTPVDVSSPATTANVSLFPLTVSGSVTNTSGTALVGVDIVLSGDTVMMTTTGSKGEYLLSKVPSGSYYLIASVSGYRTDSVFLSIDGISKIQDFVLKKVTSVSGTVYDAFSTSLQNAIVDLIGPDTDQTMTGSFGTYSFADVVEGDYTIQASLSGYITKSKQVTVAGSPKIVDFHLPAQTEVLGLVLDSVTSNPIAGAEVVFEGGGLMFFDTTDAGGNYNLGLIPQGTYLATATALGYAPKSFGVVVTGFLILLEFDLQPQYGSIIGTVIDAQTGNLVDSAKVMVTGPVIDLSFIDIDGLYALDNLPYGEYDISVTAPGFLENHRHVMLVSSQIVEDFVLSTELGTVAMRIVLTWNSLPPDMDLHDWVFGTGGDTTFVNWLSPGTLLTYPFAELDIDDVDGFGPETISIGQFVNSCKIYIDNYSHRQDSLETPLTLSGARLEVYEGISKILDLQVPTVGIGDWWHAFDLDPAGNITIVNQIEDLGPLAAPRIPVKDSTPRQ